MNVLAQLAAAASVGVEQLRADRVPVDQEAFDAAVQVLWNLAVLVEDRHRRALAPVDAERKLADDGCMTSTEVAAITDVTPAAVRLAAAEGRLDGSKDHQGWWRFTAEAVESWEAGRARG